MQETSGELDSFQQEPAAVVAADSDSNPQDLVALLELYEGQLRVPVHYSLQYVEGEAAPKVVGYLRLAYGQGNVANRLLKAAGRPGCLIGPNGEAQRVLITSTDPSEAPGYLCAFTLK